MKCAPNEFPTMSDTNYPSIIQQFAVNFQYPVVFSDNVFGSQNVEWLSVFPAGKQAKMLFLMEESLVGAFPELPRQIEEWANNKPNEVLLFHQPIVLPGGEACKNNYNLVTQIQELVNTLKIDRHSYLAAIGGGAFLDMAGFAASIAHRGIRFLRIPTTVLAQNDAGIGVKTSINNFGKKNFTGTFTPPFAVINDFAFLKTLDDRNALAGVAEAVKVALIKDSAFFAWLENNAQALKRREANATRYMIYRCAELHLQHIASADPFERGSRRPLDFGHWAAHKLEAISNYSVLHGEAVAAGIMLDTLYSCKQGFISATEAQRVANLFFALGLKVFFNEMGNDPNNLLSGLEEFREHLGGELCITLLKAVGEGFETNTINLETMALSLVTLQNLQQEQDQKAVSISSKTQNSISKESKNIDSSEQITNGSLLTYCTNIHGGETWAETFAELNKYVPFVKNGISPNRNFPLGLRLSAKAAAELLEADNLPQFKTWLSEKGLFVPCINGFPYGSFHGEVVKDEVHQPDWTTSDRVEYTLNLVKILASLLPKGIKGSISTSPISYTPWLKGKVDMKRGKVIGAANEGIMKVAFALMELYRTDIHISLDFEPEPDGLLEDAKGFIEWFLFSLLPFSRLQRFLHYPETKVAEFENMVRRHIGICYDVCHFAVLYKDQEKSLFALKEAGINIGRIQLSAALEANLSGNLQSRTSVMDEIAGLNDPVYLHQVAAISKQGTLERFKDLPQAITSFTKREYQFMRTHFHVPVFTEGYGNLFSTAPEVEKAIKFVLKHNLCNLFEVETYTWQVLPGALKTDLVENINRELLWASERVYKA